MKGKREVLGQRGTTKECKIAYAVVIGLTLGVFWAFVRPNGFVTPTASSAGRVFNRLGASSRKLEGGVLSLEAKVLMLEREVQRLEKENEELGHFKIKNDVLEQEKSAAVKQLEALSPSIKVGPASTVKSTRTNQRVQADESINLRLAALLKKIAVNGELIVSISNNNVRDMLQIWFESIQRVGVTNYLVVALDDKIAKFCTDHYVPVYISQDATISKSQAGTGDNHAISGLFYIRPTVPSIELLDRVTAKLAKEKVWDQAVFNELYMQKVHKYCGIRHLVERRFPQRLLTLEF